MFRKWSKTPQKQHFFQHAALATKDPKMKIWLDEKHLQKHELLGLFKSLELPKKGKNKGVSGLTNTTLPEKFKRYVFKDWEEIIHQRNIAAHETEGELAGLLEHPLLEGANRLYEC